MTNRAAARRQSSIEAAGDASSDDAPSRKRARVRVSRACEECRRRKERCDGGQPQCQRCIKASRTCSYNQSRKRGLRTGYVRGLEILLGLVIHSCPGAEDLMLSILRKHSQQIEDAPGDTNTSAPTTVSLLESWRNSAASGDLQKALLASEAEEDEESYLQDLDVKLTTSFNSLPRHVSGESMELPNSPPIILPDDSLIPSQPTSNPTHNLMSQEPPLAPLPESTSLETGLSLPSLPSNWSQLINLYISTTHCWLPIVEKYTLFRSASLWPDTSSSCRGSCLSPGEAASLWATLAYGSCLSESLQQSSPLLSGHGINDTECSLICTRAKRLAMEDQGSHGDGHVHAFLVLSLVDITREAWSNAWIWVGRAIYTATTLNIIPLGDKRSYQPTEQSKRLFNGCFILDCLVSTRLGYRSYFERDDLLRMGSMSVDGLEEWEPWHPASNPHHQIRPSCGSSRALSLFQTLSSLTGILNVLHRTPDSALTNGILDGLLGQLLLNWEKMPTSNSMPSNSSILPPHITHLRITAATVFVLLQTRIRRDPEMARRRNAVIIPSTLHDTLRFLECTEKSSKLLSAPQVPPTTSIFFQLLQKRGVSSPTYALYPGWTCEKGLTIPHTRNEGNGKVELTIDPLLQLAEGVRETPPFNSPSRPAPSMPTQNAPGLPSPVSTADHAIRGTSTTTSTFLNDVQLAAEETNFNPEIQHNAENNPVNPATIQPGVPEEGGLFNQLSLLDTNDWPAVSEDFMEHLGFSREGNVVDFQSIFPT